MSPVPNYLRRASTHTISEGSYDPGLLRAGVIVRVVGVFRITSAARFSFGIVRLVESAVKRTGKPRLMWRGFLRCSFSLAI